MGLKTTLSPLLPPVSISLHSHSRALFPNQKHLFKAHLLLCPLTPAPYSQPGSPPQIKECNSSSSPPALNKHFGTGIILQRFSHISVSLVKRGWHLCLTVLCAAAVCVIMITPIAWSLTLKVLLRRPPGSQTWAGPPTTTHTPWENRSKEQWSPGAWNPSGVFPALPPLTKHGLRQVRTGSQGAKAVSKP